MSLRARSLLVPFVAVGLILGGCEQREAPRATAESGSAARTDSVPEAPAPVPAARARAAAPAVVGDPAPTPGAPKAPAIPQLPFQLPTLPANLRLPFPLPQGLPTAPPAPSAPKAPPAAPKATPAPQPVAASRVTVFGIQGCGACASLKSKLAAKAIPYQYVDIDAAKRETVPSQAFGRVPKTRVIGRDGSTTWVEGDDAEKIERAYKA